MSLNERELSVYIGGGVYVVTPYTYIDNNQLGQEGNGRRRGVESKAYQNFHLIARGSAFETVAWLEMAIVDSTLTKEFVTKLGERIVTLNVILVKESYLE